MENKKFVRVGLGVYIINDKKQVLFGKRKGAHAKGDWSAPGGHLEFGESWEECVTREVTEEVGIEIENIRFGTVTNDIFQKDSKHYITIHMITDYKSGVVQLLEPDKCSEWKWFDWENLPSPLLVSTQNAIKQGFNPIK